MVKRNVIGMDLEEKYSAVTIEKVRINEAMWMEQRTVNPREKESLP